MPSSSPPSAAGVPPSSSTIAEAYEAKLRAMKKRALLVAGLQKTSRFFGICALTWATVVLLGGFASALKLLDFYLISILLILEAARLSTTEVFSKLLSKSLFREHPRPEQFEFKDLQYFWASRLDLVGQGSGCLVAMVGLLLAAVRFGISGRHHFTERDQSNGSHSNISPALYTFYVLVILNSASAIASGVCRPFLRRSSEDSLMCYHDEVYKTAMSVGMPEADEIDTFEFAFKKLASDHMRNIRPLTIKKGNKNLIRYMYHSKNGVGITCEYLKSGDVWKQIVAANLPGFWVEEIRIEKQVALFWALQDKLYGAGQVAEAAANSIQCLSKAWAQRPEKHPFLLCNPSQINSRNVVDTLIDVLLRPIRPTLLFQLRALEGCCRSQQVLKHIYKQSSREQDVLCQQLQQLIAATNQEHHASDQHAQTLSRPEELCLKLQSIVRDRSSGPRQPTRLYAANALHALLCFGGELAEDVKKSLGEMVQERIDPAQRMEVGGYVWPAERDMLNTLRASLDLPPYEWGNVRIVPRDAPTADPEPSACKTSNGALNSFA